MKKIISFIILIISLSFLHVSLLSSVGAVSSEATNMGESQEDTTTDSASDANSSIDSDLLNGVAYSDHKGDSVVYHFGVVFAMFALVLIVGKLEEILLKSMVSLQLLESCLMVLI